MPGHYHIVSENILNQVHIARGGLDHLDLDFFRKQKIMDFLVKSAERHSVEMEFSATDGEHSFPRKVNPGRAKRICIDNLRLANHYFSRKYSGTLDLETIRTCGALISGRDSLPYRNCSSFPAGAGFIYPDHEKIKDEMELFVDASARLVDPVEKAVHAHFNITRIHPFSDGNGRLARLVQNGILERANYPPIIIYTFEKPEYVRLLRRASIEHMENKGELKTQQVNFYDYLALKLRDSLNEARTKSRKN